MAAKSTVKVRFNIVDFLVVIAILAAIAALVFRGTILKFIGSVIYTEDAVLSVRIERTTPEQASGINEGDILYLGDDELGEISSCSVTDSRIILFSEDENENGAFIRVNDGGHCDVICNINVKGAFNSDGFYLFGDRYVGVGQTLTVASGTYTCEVTVVSIS
mgnify:CR=1 FL=1